MRKIAAPIVIAASFLLVACEGEKSPTTAVTDAANKAAAATKDAAAKGTDAVKDAANKAAAATKDAAAKGTDAVKDAAAKGTDAVKDAAAKGADMMSQTGANEMVTKAIDGAKSQYAALKAKAANAPAAVKPQVDALMTSIDKQINDISAKATQLKSATPDTWKKLVDETKPMIEKLTASIKEVTAKLGA